MWKMDEEKFLMTPASHSLAPLVVSPVLFYLSYDTVDYGANMEIMFI